MKTAIFGIALAALALPAHAVEFTAVQPDKSTLSFVSKQMGVPVDGSFKRFKATLNFDAAQPQAARVSFELDLSSIDAGSKEANNEVVGKDWFNVKQFPTAQFKSSAVKALGGNRYEVRGPLTIKGKTREVVAPFTLKTEGANGLFEGAFTLKRIEYGIGEGDWADPATVADEVQIRFRIVAAPGKK